MEVDEPSDWQEAAPAAVNQTAPAPPEYEIVHGFKFVKDPNSSVGSSPSKSTPNETAPEQQSSTTVKTANKPKKPSKPKGTSKNKLQKADAAKMNGTSAELDAAARKSNKKTSSKSKPIKTGDSGKKPIKKKQKTTASTSKALEQTLEPADAEAFHRDHYEPIPVGRAYDPDAESEEEDDRLWCVCNRKYIPGSLMICCDGCDDWYHPTCLGMDEDDIVLVNSFFCPKCTEKDGRKTTWFARCSRQGCLNAQLALSKFCSDYCGMEVAATKLAKVKFDPMDIWDYVKDAQKRQGFVLHHDPHAAEQTEENFRLALFSSATPPSVQTRTKYQLENSPSKVELRTALPNFDDDKEELAAQRRLQTLNTAREENKAQREAVQRAIRLLEARYQLYRIAYKSWEHSTSHPPDQEGNADSSSKTEKAKGTSKGTSINDAPCGLDERLTWEDAEWEAWVDSPTGQIKLKDENGPEVRESERGLVCTIPRKRCDRHQGWQKLHDTALDLDLSLQQRKAEKLQQADEELGQQLQDHLRLQESLKLQKKVKMPGGLPLPAVNILNANGSL